MLTWGFDPSQRSMMDQDLRVDSPPPPPLRFIIAPTIPPLQGWQFTHLDQPDYARRSCHFDFLKPRFVFASVSCLECVRLPRGSLAKVCMDLCGFSSAVRPESAVSRYTSTPHLLSTHPCIFVVLSPRLLVSLHPRDLFGFSVQPYTVLGVACYFDPC